MNLTIELINKVAKEVSEELLKTRPSNAIGILVKGNNFERYHKLEEKNKFGSASTYYGGGPISLRSVIKRAIMSAVCGSEGKRGVMSVEEAMNLTYTWSTTSPNGYDKETIFGKLG